MIASSQGAVIATSQRGEFRITVTGARVSEDGVVLDLEVLKESGSDGVLTIQAAHRNDTRLVTADGIEINYGFATRPNGSQQLYDEANLIVGTPMRLSMLFNGSFDKSVQCRRIEIEAYHRREKLVFRLENIEAKKP